MVGKNFPIGRVIFFVTRNIHKFNEASKLLTKYDIATAMLKTKKAEIQDDDLENISKTGALEAFKRSGLPLIVEDAGLFIKALNGFPGPYSSYVYRTTGNNGILKLTRGVTDRYAQFRSAVAYCGQDGSVKSFLGISEGRIAGEPRGSSGFGFDPIFKPLRGSGKTFAEMSTEEKNMFSHRSRALRKFAEYYKSLKQSF